MRCDSHVSLLAHTLTSPCLGHEPKVKVATIVVVCDSTYTMESKDELVFFYFSFIQYLLSFETNVSCDLSKTINEILVANVTCD
jgi:NADPH-dependent 7-cyano-7-deazaguanine reductase QueF-like protein